MAHLIDVWINFPQKFAARDLRDLAKRTDDYETNMRMVTSKAMEETADYVMQEIVNKAPKASGHLAESVNISKGSGEGGRSNMVVNVGEGLYRPYHIYQEVGAIPDKFVPVFWMHSPYGGINGTAIAGRINKPNRSGTSRDRTYKAKFVRVYEGRTIGPYVKVMKQGRPYVAPAVKKGAKRLADICSARMEEAFNRHLAAVAARKR